MTARVTPSMKGFYQLRKLPEREPVNSGCPSRLDLRKSLFFDGGHHHVISLRSRRIEHKKWKTAVAGNETDFFLGSHFTGNAAIKLTTLKIISHAPPSAASRSWKPYSQRQSNTPEG